VDQVSQQDCSLTHPAPVCRVANAAYCIALASLIQSSNRGISNIQRREEALSRALQYAQRVTEESRNGSSSDVVTWLSDSRNTIGLSYTHQMGYVGIAFSHAFRHLIQGTPFMEAMEETLAGGGDTDTNACIIGGLLGAAEGFSSLPMDSVEKLLLSDDSRGACPHRPLHLHPSKVASLLDQVLISCPSSLRMSVDVSVLSSLVFDGIPTDDFRE
jgi:ADP-ribosyl-[dinitrogen reductase] hydrolase